MSFKYTEEDELNEFLDDMGCPVIDELEVSELVKGEFPDVQITND